jgi:hypothetical protein
MTCECCGFKLIESHHFCPNCGRKKAIVNSDVRPIEERFLQHWLMEARITPGACSAADEVSMLRSFSAMYRQAALEAVAEIGVDIEDADGANRDSFLHFLELHLGPSFRGI